MVSSLRTSDYCASRCRRTADEFWFAQIWRIDSLKRVFGIQLMVVCPDLILEQVLASHSQPNSELLEVANGFQIRRLRLPQNCGRLVNA